MRVALVAREVYPFAGGGIAPIVAAAARHLSQIAEVTIVTSADHRERHAELDAAGDDRLPPGVRWIFVEEPTPDDAAPFFSHMHAYSANADRALRTAFPDRGPDLIEFCDYLAEGFVTVQARHTRDPWLEDTLVCVRLHTTTEIVSVLDGHQPDDFATQAMFEAERYCLQRCDRLLYSGGDVLGTYERFYGADRLAAAVKIPDAFHLEDDESDAAGAMPSEDEPLRMLYLGRYERRKGVQNLIRAITALPRADVELTLLGGDTNTAALGGSLLGQLRLMADDDPRIHFHEGVPRHEVPQWIRNAHVVVVPSLWECWPNTAREALMHNRPLLGTPVGGLVDMVEPGRSGWLARDAGPEALAELIADLAAFPAQVADLIRAGGPRARWRELTDPESLRRAYAGLVAASPSRPPRRRRARPPLVSVVVPYFQLEEHVEETLRSALAQTHPAVEVVLVNDGSLREQDAFVYDLAAGLGVRVVTQANSGLGPARNFGIRASLGEYVLPLDADDVIDPAFVERCVDALERDPDLAYVTTWVRYMGEDGTPYPQEVNYPPFGNWSSLIDRNNVAGTCSAVMRRSIFDAGHAYSPDLTSYEDWFLYREMHHAGLWGAVIPEALFHYRVRATSMMREIGDPLVTRLYDEMRAHVRERGMAWVAPASA